MDDGIFASPSGSDINQEIMEIGVKFYIEYQGTLDNYIGFNIVSLSNRKINLLQPQLIDQILKDVNLARRAPPHSTSAKSSVILRQDLSAPPFCHWFRYRSVVININLL